MRSETTSGLVRRTGAVAALAAAVLAVPAAASVAADPADALPRYTPRGIELSLAGGDTLRLWTSDNDKVVRSQRQDAATGEWSDPRVVLRRKNLYCGGLDARTSNGAVAVTALCDRGGYYEDQAPHSSQALWSADTVTWSTHPLRGEAYGEPGISPDGSSAVWIDAEGYVTRSPAGFEDHVLDTPGQEYTATATVTDQQQVSYVYTAQRGRRCDFTILTRTGDGPTARQDVPFEDGCYDGALENVGVDTVWSGDLGDLAQRTTLSRPDSSSPWTITRIAPASAPGLVDHDRDRLATDFVHAPGLPLLALGSGGRHRIGAQAYDEASQTWGPVVVAYDAGSARCSWGETWVEPEADVIAVDVRCDGRHVVLTTADGRSWQALRMGRNTFGISADGSYVAVPSQSQTHVISAESGVVTLPGGVRGPCDVVVPDGPDGAVRLVARPGDRGWPTVLEHSSADGWERLSVTRLPTYRSACRDTTTYAYDLPYRFGVYARTKGYAVRIVERDGTWTVRRSRG